MNRQPMRLCLWVQAGLLGSLGLYVTMAFAISTAEDKWGSIVVFSTALLLPPLLYLFTLSRYLRDSTQGSGLSGLGDKGPGAFPLALSVVLYLPLTVLMGLLGSIPLLLVLWLFCAYGYRLLGREHLLVTTETIPSPRRLHRWLEATRFFSPPVVLLLGVLLMAYSIFVTKTDALGLLKSQVTWITAEYGLGNRISAAALFLKYFGRFVYEGSLLLAVCTAAFLVAYRFSSNKLRTSRSVILLALLAGFLAICSITDFYFSWLSFLFYEYPHEHSGVVNWILFVLFFLHWLMPLLFAVAVLRSPAEGRRAESPELKTLLVFYMPLLLFDLAMTPFFLGDFGDLFILASFLGLQFLTWGYLDLVGNSRLATKWEAR